MRKPEARPLALVVVLMLTTSLFAGTVDEILESKQLAASYNPVLLDYLLNEGAGHLPEAKRNAAIDQLVTALKADIEITPEEQRAASLAAAAAGMAQIFGGRDASEMGGVAQDATWQIWNGWVDSAIVLEKAGYKADAVAFYQKCIDIYPYSDLKGRCAVALAKSDPDTAVERLMALTEKPDPEVVKPVLILLGKLAGSEGFPADKREVVIARIEEFGKGMKKATYGEAVCQGLVETGDPAVVPTLQGLSKGMMNSNFYACSRRGLLFEFDDRSVVPLLEKDLKEGMMSTAKPHDRLFASRLLVLAGEDSGYQWAEEKLTAPPAGKMSRFMKASSDDFDYKPSLVSILASGQKDKSLPVLNKAFVAAENGSWLQTWIAIGMLELGDGSHIDLVRESLTVPEWDFTSVRAALALAKHGDFSGVAALAEVYDRARSGDEASPGRELLAYLSGEGASWEANKKAQHARSIALRRQIASALADLDLSDGVPLLVRMLDDDEDSVRIGTAYALTRMKCDGTSGGLEKAMGVDYGDAGKSSRNPIIHARLVRHAGALDASSAIGKGLESPYVAVKFLASTLK